MLNSCHTSTLVILCSTTWCWYGAYRCWRETKDDPWRLFEEYEVAGFFQLWHARDPHVLGEDGAWTHPFYDPHWRHAGGYDSAHAMRWSVNNR